MLISGLRTDFKGMLILSAAAILPGNLLPTTFGWVAALICMGFAVTSVTNAKGWVDAIKYVAASFAISLALVFLLFYMFWDEIQKAQAPGADRGNPTVQTEPQAPSGSRQPVSRDADTSGSSSGAPIGAYDALKDQLTPEERAAIERQIKIP